MEFILKNISTVKGAHFDEDNNLKIVVHITSAIKEIPYEGKFQQVDYNITLDLPKYQLPEAINALLPSIAQEWITATYPNT